MFASVGDACKCLTSFWKRAPAKKHRKEIGFQAKKTRRNQSITLRATMSQTDTHTHTETDIDIKPIITLPILYLVVG